MSVFGLMNYIGSIQGLQDAYNTHFNLSPGDDTHWSDYSDSPIFPVNEQPESDKFYILYNFAEGHPPNGWWNVEYTVAMKVHTNNIKLLNDVTKILRQELGDYNFAAERVGNWMAANNVDSQPVNYIRYNGSDFVDAQEQENGVYSVILTFNLNVVDC